MRQAPVEIDARIEHTELIHKVHTSTLVLHVEGRQHQTLSLPIHYDPHGEKHGTLGRYYGLVQHLLKAVGVAEADANVTHFAGLRGHCFRFRLRQTGMRDDLGTPVPAYAIDMARHIEAWAAYIEPDPAEALSAEEIMALIAVEKQP